MTFTDKKQLMEFIDRKSFGRCNVFISMSDLDKFIDEFIEFQTNDENNLEDDFYA